MTITNTPVEKTTGKTFKNTPFHPNATNGEQINQCDNRQYYQWVPKEIWPELENEVNNMFEFLHTAASNLNKFGRGKPGPAELPRRVLENVGLKAFINRPHNLYVERDEHGAITKYAIKLVYTPFPKKDVHVSVKNNSLIIAIGKEDLPTEQNCVYCNISKRCETITIYLSDRNIDVEKITAKCDDGILTVEIPTKVAAPRVIEIV